jgi:hypothetical protein
MPPSLEVKGTEAGTRDDPLVGIDLIVADVASRDHVTQELLRIARRSAA